MAYRIINRHDGFVILPNGERVEKQNFAVVEKIDHAYRKLEKRGLITIHPFYGGEVSLPSSPKEGACFINGDIAYKYTKGHWEEKEVKPPLLPVTVKDGHQYHTEDRVYERQGKHWVVLGGSKNLVYHDPLTQSRLDELAELAEARFTKKPEPPPTTFRKNPISDEVLLMIDISNVNLVKFAQDAYELTPISGKAAMLKVVNSNTLSQKVAENLVLEYKDDPNIALQMGKIKNRDCRITVYRDGSSLFIESNWMGHTAEELRDLLGRQNINI